LNYPPPLRRLLGGVASGALSNAFALGKSIIYRYLNVSPSRSRYITGIVIQMIIGQKTWYVYVAVVISATTAGDVVMFHQDSYRYFKSDIKHK